MSPCFRLLAAAVTFAAAASEGTCGAGGNASCIADGDDGSLMQTKHKSEQLGGASAARLAKPPEMAVSRDGREATVSMEYAGQQLRFALRAAPLFDEEEEEQGGAFMLEEGVFTDRRHAVQKNAQRFVQDKHGETASFLLHADGAVSGIFEHAGRLVHFSPAAWSRQHGKTGPALGQLAAQHHVSEVTWEQVMKPNKGKGPVWKKDSQGNEFVEDPRTDEWPPVGDSTAQRAAPGSVDSFEGDPFQPPSCFPNDATVHRMKIGVIADESAANMLADPLDIFPLMQDYVNAASVIYRGQMRVQLAIGRMYSPANFSNPPDVFMGCENGPTGELTENKLMQLRDQPKPKAALWHLFTNCGDNFGIVGIAYLSALCREPLNVGVTQIIDGPGDGVRPDSWTWVILAHELGHNFGAQHSFEDGLGTTGGIMDYGDGTLNGVYQFHKQYRREEMCKELTEALNKTDGRDCRNTFGPV